jgi:intracellular sulfur oxidation DsrE/DsrF family protein
MHVRAGVPIDNIDVALVVHGKASYDLMTDVAFAEKFSKKNPSSTLLTQLLKNKVKIFVCGQSSSHLGLTKTLFNNDIEMSLSAMTANALLQQEGYTLNPF